MILGMPRRHFAAFIALCGVAAAAVAHDDVAGTRYVAQEGRDADDCDDRAAPCRTLAYALGQTMFGDAIKVAAGHYDLSRIDIESLLFGKQGLRGGYSTADQYHTENAEVNRTIVTGVDPEWRNTLVAHGFLPVDANGDPLPAQAVQAQAATGCLNGAAGRFPCWNIDFHAQLSLQDFSSQPASLSNLWGFVDADDNREYAIVGLNNGTAVIEVTDPDHPREVGFIAGVFSSWREAKVYQLFNATSNRHEAYAYMSTEGSDGGLQIIDLSNLPASVTLANTLRDFATSHTLYISNVDYATNKALPGQQAFLYVAGANVAAGRFRIYDLVDPANPRLVTTNPGLGTDTPYMHDSTSLLIVDNRTTQCAAAHNPCEVLVDFNVERVELWDVTDKAQPAHLGGATYPNARYIHSGWPSADGNFIIVHDELDELRVSGLHTSIYTMDIGDLRTPTFVTSFTGASTSTDHNGYTIGNRHYTSHYKRGLVIFDSRSRRVCGRRVTSTRFLRPAQTRRAPRGPGGFIRFCRPERCW